MEGDNTCVERMKLSVQKESWAKIRGVRVMEEPKKVGGVEALKRMGWGGALAFFHELPMEEVKKRLGEVCSSWGLEEFEELRQEAKRQKTALDIEENKVVQNPSSGLKDISWVPQTGHADLKGRMHGIELERARALLPRVSWPTTYEVFKEDASRARRFPAREDRGRGKGPTDQEAG